MDDRHLCVHIYMYICIYIRMHTYKRIWECLHIVLTSVKKKIPSFPEISLPFNPKPEGSNPEPESLAIAPKP